MYLSTASRSSQPAPPVRAGGAPVPPGELLIGPVANRHQRLAAGMLVRRMYAWRGYASDTGHERPGNPNRLALGAWQDEDLVATLTVGRDAHAGLLSEALYGQEIAGLRRVGRTLCEFSRLAVDPDYSSRHLLPMLFSSAHHYALGFGATDAVIEVNPRHARFYEREFGFAQIGDRRICPRVEAPAVLMYRNLDGSVAIAA